MFFIQLSDKQTPDFKLFFIVSYFLTCLQKHLTYYSKICDVTIYFKLIYLEKERNERFNHIALYQFFQQTYENPTKYQVHRSHGS